MLERRVGGGWGAPAIPATGDFMTTQDWRAITGRCGSSGGTPRHLGALVLGSFGLLLLATVSRAQEKEVTAEVQAAADRFVQAFNAGDAEAVSQQFVPEGEWIDEEGTVYRGRGEIKTLFTRYFGQFAGTRLTVEIESVRTVGPQLAIEEGTRVLARETDGGRAQLRYSTVRTKVGNEWLIASVREFTDDPPARPGDYLQPLAWLVGDWINEGGEASVRISYRWSDDKNYLLGEFQVVAAGKPQRQTTQRIGWDPQAQTIRSWLFEADGAFSEGRWTQVPDAAAGNPDVWVLKSTGVLADGQSGSATLRLRRQGADRFHLEGRDRLIGSMAAEDFEIVVTRRPPAAQR